MFPDGRAMRLPVEGTIAQGELRDDFELPASTRTAPSGPRLYGAGSMGPARRAVRLLAGPDRDGRAARARSTALQHLLPVCHGQQGNGLGSVALRAKALDAQKWAGRSQVLVTDNAKETQRRALHIVSQGVSTMKGYGSQIVPRDRWAIVAYVRALQKTQGIDRRDLDALGVDPADLKPAPTIDEMRVSSTDSAR